MYQRKVHSQQGFTLVELAIVLVIIGLIVGGVLVGQDMIKAAEVRATVGQYEKYNAALNTFRTRFNGMPGDLTGGAGGQAANFGMTVRAGGAADGDGNGLLEGCTAGAIVAGCETTLFWSDLSSANLVDGRFATAADGLGIGGGAAITAAQVPLVFPAAKLGRGNYFTVFASNGLNYYQITGIGSVSAAGVYTLSTNLTPSEAFNIDNKVDDGAPLTGIVTAREGTGPLNVLAAAGAATCVFTGGTAYNTTSAQLASTPLCELRLRFN